MAFCADRSRFTCFSKAASIGGEWVAILEVVPLPTIPERERLVHVKRPLLAEIGQQ